jgi:hypothetical protein
MTTLVAMITPFSGSNNTVSLPGGSQTYALAGGIAQVAVVDVPVALRAGWQLHGGSAVAYAAASVRAMSAPATFVGSSVTLPDQTTSAITSGVAQIPSQFVAFMTEQGWRQVGVVAGS